jgi:uncharacterized membrane protein YkvA (DUF1232 family)
MNFLDSLFRYFTVNISNNQFFKMALDRAAKLTGKPGRIISLLAQLSVKIYHTEGSSPSIKMIRDHFRVISRMIKAHVSGEYKIRSIRIFVTLLAAIIYFINPFDLIPDLIFGVGLADDLAVLTWAYRAAADEINSFKNWENSSTSPIILS